MRVILFGILMLYIFGGLPGTGKSTLSAALAQRTHAIYLRIDTIEQAMRCSGLSVEGAAGYFVGYGIASENLRLGINVVADSVNPIGITRDAWRNVAIQHKIPFVEIEIICSDQAEHRNRIESRQSNIAGLILPTWKSVTEREYEQWDTEHIILDTAGHTSDESISHLFEAIDNWSLKS